MGEVEIMINLYNVRLGQGDVGGLWLAGGLGREETLERLLALNLERMKT